MLGTWVSGLRAAGGVTLLGLSLCLPHPAFAQVDEQRAAARSLATDGAKAFNEGRWQDAVDLFTRAESLLHAPPHLLFLARAQERLGHLIRAREAYLRITKETLTASSPQAFRDAQASAEQELKAIEPRICNLTISVEGADGAADLSVMVDGAPLPPALIGVPRPTDPGEHRIEAVAAGFRGEPTTLRLLDGERKQVVLRLEPDPSAAAATPVALTELPADRAATSTDAGVETSSDGSGMRIGSYVAFGVGVLGLGMGTYFLIDSRGKRADADTKESECKASGPCLAGDPLAEETASLDDDARSALKLSIVGFAVGGVGIATGTALFLLAGPSESGQASGFSIRPVLGLGTAGVVGKF
jgi:hypothetical protein